MYPKCRTPGDRACNPGWPLAPTNLREKVGGRVHRKLTLQLTQRSPVCAIECLHFACISRPLAFAQFFEIVMRSALARTTLQLAVLIVLPTFFRRAVCSRAIVLLEGRSALIYHWKKKSSPSSLSRKTRAHSITMPPTG